MRIRKLYSEFFNSEKAGGFILLLCTIFSLMLTNIFIGDAYIEFWHTKIAGDSLEHWINDGLMTIFFLLIGLELKREIFRGELSKLKNALLPIFAAIGGMVLPAGFYFIFNYGKDTLAGTGIPTATDIAFALGILSLVGPGVPVSLKIFLTALAVIDDLGAILIIAFFYTGDLSWAHLFLSLGIFTILLVLNVFKIKSLVVYLAGGIVMWYFMSQSGVHATITGVMLAFAVPFGKKGGPSPSHTLQHLLHKPVAFFVLPLFALANTAVALHSDFGSAIFEKYSLGIATGLILGKPLGILFLSFLGIKSRLCRLPVNVTWKMILGVCCLGGIGFTMSIFITLLAFNNDIIINNAKLVILISSAIAGLTGYILLYSILGRERKVRS